jgi:Holliday junction resolvase
MRHEHMNRKKMQTPPADADRLIQSVLAELGWDADPSAVAEKVKLLDISLPCEDEFSVICGWLGKCQLLHKLDQQQIPIRSRQEFQVPDLLALFTTQSKKIPLLIEVKSKKAKKLSLTPIYLRKLKNYADLLGMPLLIAWKFENLWTLFEASHLKQALKNFNITLGLAMKENLLGVLAGDLAYTIGAGAGVHFRFRKNEMVGQEEGEDGTTERWKMTVDDAAFTDHTGTRRTDLDSQVSSLFTCWGLEQQEEHTDTHIKVSFVAGSEGMQFSHTALVRLLNWESPKDGRPNWRGLLREEMVTKSIENFSGALDAALRQKVVYYIFHLRPNTMPDFLLPQSSCDLP